MRSNTFIVDLFICINETCSFNGFFVKSETGTSLCPVDFWVVLLTIGLYC